MGNQTYWNRKTKLILLMGLSMLMMAFLALGAPGSVSSVAAATAEPSSAQVETFSSGQAIAPEISEDIRVLLEEMTLVQLLWEQYGYAATACAGVGLNNIQPLAHGPMILLPNAGDLSVEGSNVSIKVSPEGAISFVPRVQGQMIRVPMDIGNKQTGEEVLSLTFDEARQLMAAGKMIWTAKDQGPLGNGHGLPGHIANCDPRFDTGQYEEFVDADEDGDVS